MAQAQHWPSFRGANASGVADAGQPPVTWDGVKSINIAWKTAIPGLGHSSPVVWGDRVFITTAISGNPQSVFRRDVVTRQGEIINIDSSKDVSPHAWRLYSLDKRTGAILWSRTAAEGVPRTDRHMKNSHASATPATDGVHVVAFFGSEGLYCYDVNGKLLWKQDLGVLDAGSFDDADFQWGTASSPIIHDNLVFVQCDIQTGSFVAAFDVATGKQVWRTMRDETPSWSTPTVYRGAGRTELVTNATRYARGYDARTGRELWKLAGNSENVAPTPIVTEDLIFVSSGYRPTQPIYAIRPGAAGDISLTGGATSSEQIAWSVTRGGPYIPTPIVYRDQLYVAANNGVLTAYDARTGERIYQRRLGDSGGAYAASPVAANGRLYFTSEDGDVLVVKAGPEYELLATNPMGEVCLATPAVAGDMIVMRTQHHVFAIAEGGAVRARTKARGRR
jgi:outer membrane protein assembly factor BamB